ncbi:MAG: 6-phosphogluconolactonase [Desulfuromonadales bacterium]|jgi:6-phosphogluconolactonase
MNRADKDIIRVFSDHEALSRAAADLFNQRAQAAVRDRGCFCVALAGGTTPRRTYELLALPPFHEEVPWPEVHVFWGDERCVPPQDPQSNERMARKALLDRVPLLEEQIHPIRCAGEPAGVARNYEKLLREYFGEKGPSFDLVFLGLGENGHTASLFPGEPVLREKERWAAEVFPGAEGLRRVTLTAPLLNRAREVAFLVSGKEKAQVLLEVLEGPEDPERLPAQLIRPEPGRLHWFVDREANRLAGLVEV